MRKEEFADYCAMLEGIGELPGIDQAFFYAFCSKGEQNKKTSLESSEDRKKFLKIEKGERYAPQQ